MKCDTSAHDIEEDSVKLRFLVTFLILFVLWLIVYVTVAAASSEKLTDTTNVP